MAESQSERLFQALVRFIDHMETSERTLEWIEEQAREGAQVVREIASTVNRECYVQLSERLLEEALSLSQALAPVAPPTARNPACKPHGECVSPQLSHLCLGALGGTAQLMWAPAVSS